MAQQQAVADTCDLTRATLALALRAFAVPLFALVVAAGLMFALAPGRFGIFAELAALVACLAMGWLALRASRRDRA